MPEPFSPAVPDRNASRRAATAFALTLAALAVLPAGPPAAAQIEPLTLRVADAEAPPGGTVAVVLRTYASRPVSQGRVCGGPRVPVPLGPAASAELPLGGDTPFAAFLPAASRVYASLGDPDEFFTWNGATQTLDVDFTSASSTINAEDGVLAVFTFTLDGGLAPGTVYDLQLGAAETFLKDPLGRLIPIDIRPGALRVRAALSNPALTIDAPKVHPGSGAELEIGTAEPFALASGQIEIVYDPAIADGVPTIRTDPRHGSVSSTVSFPSPGRLRIAFTSDGSLNAQVPGALFSVVIPTKASNPIGSTSSVAFEPAQTFLVGPGPSPRPVNLSGDLIEFVSRPHIWSDAFEDGSLWVWSRRSP